MWARRSRWYLLGWICTAHAAGASVPRRPEVTLSSLDGIVLGYDPATLDERVDLAAAGRRLDELGELRSLSALTEKATLLRLVERIDEAWEVASAAVRDARFTGDRQDLLDARVIRAEVMAARGKADEALTELNGCFDEADANEWHELAARASLARGHIAFSRHDYEQALQHFSSAVFLRQKADADEATMESALVAAAAAESFVAGRNGGTGAGVASPPEATSEPEAASAPDTVSTPSTTPAPAEDSEPAGPIEAAVREAAARSVRDER